MAKSKITLAARQAAIRGERPWPGESPRSRTQKLTADEKLHRQKVIEMMQESVEERFFELLKAAEPLNRACQDAKRIIMERFVNNPEPEVESDRTPKVHENLSRIAGALFQEAVEKRRKAMILQVEAARMDAEAQEIISRVEKERRENTRT